MSKFYNVLLFCAPTVPAKVVAEGISNTMNKAPIIDPRALVSNLAKTETPIARYIQKNIHKTVILDLSAEMVSHFITSQSKSTIFVNTPLSPSLLLSFMNTMAKQPNRLLCVINVLPDTSGSNLEYVSTCQYDDFVGRSVKQHQEHYTACIKTMMSFYPDMMQTIDISSASFKAETEKILSHHMSFKVVPQFSFGPDFVFLGHLTRSQRSTVLDAIPVIQICLELSGSSMTIFPGSHPVPFNYDMFGQLVREYEYVVSLKIDGTRYLAVIFKDTIWFIDRSLKVYKGPQSPALLKYNMSLIDVEVYKGMIYIIDVIAVAGKSCRSDGLMARISKIKGIETVFPEGVLYVTFQKYYGTSYIAQLDSANFQSSGYDGVIFTPMTSTYHLGRNTRMMKWKPSEYNTADFIYDKSQGMLFCQARSGYSPCGKIVNPPQGLPNACIVECLPTDDPKEWTFYKIRTDKQNPNTDDIIKSTLMQHKTAISIDQMRQIFQVKK